MHIIFTQEVFTMLNLRKKVANFLFLLIAVLVSKSDIFGAQPPASLTPVLKSQLQTSFSKILVPTATFTTVQSPAPQISENVKNPLLNSGEASEFPNDRADWTWEKSNCRIQKGPEPLADPQRLEAAIRTLAIEERVTISLQGSNPVKERYRLLYREPNDCLILLYNSQDILTRTIYFTGSLITVVTGATVQKIQKTAPLAWAQVLSFLGLPPGQETISDYREIFPGAWVPNTFTVTNFTSQLPIQYAITFTAVNINCDNEFSRWEPK
jgi:hypothetical protein